MSESKHVGYSVLCCILPILTSDMVLGMDWLHAINPLIDWNNYSLSVEYGGETIRILGTKYSFFHASIKDCVLKSVVRIALNWLVRKRLSYKPQAESKYVLVSFTPPVLHICLLYV